MWKVDSGEVEFRTTEDIAHNHIENSDMNCSRVGKVEEIVERAEVIRLFEGYSATMDWFEDYVRSRPIIYFSFRKNFLYTLQTNFQHSLQPYSRLQPPLLHQAFS